MSRFAGLPASLANNTEVVAAHRQMMLDDIRRTIQMSEVRCLPFDEVLRQIERLWDADAYFDAATARRKEPGTN